MSAKIFVGNLAFATTREQLEALFAQIGPLTDVYFPTDRETGRPRGFALVEFGTDDEANSAIEKFNGFEFSGRALRVNAAEDRPKRTNFAPGGGGGYGGGGGGERSFGGGGGGGGKFGGPGKPKGSRRNIRAKKRAL